MPLSILSASNPKVKDILQLLTKSKYRRQQGQFVVEGAREIERALQLGWLGMDLWVQGEVNPHPAWESKFNRVFLAAPAVFEKLAYRPGTMGVVAVFQAKHWPLSTLRELPSNAGVLVLEGIEKPGNLGAIVRSAAAAGISAVVLADAPIDPYNPNVIRNATGAIFELPVIETSSEILIHTLTEEHYRVHATHLHSTSKELFSLQFAGRNAFVLGEEARGISDVWLDRGFENVLIPMHSQVVDSLNVSVAAALISFHWKQHSR